MALAKGSVEAWVGDPTLWPPLPGTKDDFDFGAKLGDLVLVLLLRPRTLGRRSRQGMSGERRGIVHHSCKKTRRRQATDQLIN
jgi:hypothetical protein